MTADMVVQALNMAIKRRKPIIGLIVHSDRGSQYCSHAYHDLITQLHYERFRTVAEAKLSIIDYLAFYNGKRIHSTLGYKSPLIFEHDFLRQAA